MPNVKVFVKGLGDTPVAYVAGVDGVTNVFTSQEDPSTVVVLADDHITTFHGFPFVIEREYKKKAE